jgi:hypothetical protein
LNDHLNVFFDEEKRKVIGKTLDVVETRMGSWATGQLVLMFVVGLANYIGLSLLGVPYALPLAIFAGFLEIVPYLGPIIAAIPPIVIGLGISPFMGLSALALARPSNGHVFWDRAHSRNATTPASSVPNPMAMNSRHATSHRVNPYQ